jgi:hypothetical protein
MDGLHPALASLLRLEAKLVQARALQQWPSLRFLLWKRECATTAYIKEAGEERDGGGTGGCGWGEMHAHGKKERKTLRLRPGQARPASDGAGRVRGHDHWRLSFPCEVDGRMGLLMADSPYPARVLPV